MSKIVESKLPLVLEVLRRRFGWTQTELGQLISKSQTEISWWETGTYKIPSKSGLLILETFREKATPELKDLIDRLQTSSDLQKPWEDFVV